MYPILDRADLLSYVLELLLCSCSVAHCAHYDLSFGIHCMHPEDPTTLEPTEVELEGEKRRTSA